jgi:hypothetical protein
VIPRILGLLGLGVNSPSSAYAEAPFSLNNWLSKAGFISASFD